MNNIVNNNVNIFPFVLPKVYITDYNPKANNP